jgi:uncharacterized protein YcfJ
MALIWSIDAIPELISLSPAERRRAWKLASRKALRDGRTWIALLGCGAIAMLGGVLGNLIGHEDLGSAVGSLIGLISFMQVMTRTTRRYVLDAVQETSH